MNRHYLLFSLYLLMATGCATEPSQRYLYQAEAIQAESLSQSGQHKQAADLYQTLAQSDPGYQNQFNLLAAEAFVKSGDAEEASALLSKINPALLSTEQQNKMNLLNAQISLSNGDAEDALNLLRKTQAYNLQPNNRRILYKSLAFAYSLTGDLIQSTQARIQLSPLLSHDSDQVYDNNKVIIKTLSLLSTQTLSLQQPPAPDVLGGWMALTRLLKIAKLKQNPTEFQLNLNEWELLFPQHPASFGFLQSYLQGTQNSFKRPSAIALLLPESGVFAKAAKTIKEGFMAAYYQSEDNFQPPIRFYDSSSDNPVNLYHRAVSDGAELIIGPLSKDNIQSLALSTELTIPVLALNHIQNLAKDNLFQFGLSPLDEIIQITNKANQHGQKKAVIFVPESRQGNRIKKQLEEYWQAIDGKVLESQTYNVKDNDFGKPIKKLLNLDESRSRYKRLKRILAKNIQFTERRRQDVEAIFLSASPKLARSIYPQLRFHRATDVTVYATSRVYSGRPIPSLDTDLNKINFCDIPWLFPETYQGGIRPDAFNEKSQRLAKRTLRLLALGIDSFNIISHLAQLDSLSYPGATGLLSLDTENRITRDLICAKFVSGKPVLQGSLNDTGE